MVATEPQAVEAASAKIKLLRHSLALAGPSAGFASYRTKSGHSFGSLQGYIDDWNDADGDEVTSQMALSEAKHVHPAIGIAERKIDLAVQALREAKAATKVCSFSTSSIHMYILVPEIWVG